MSADCTCMALGVIAPECKRLCKEMRAKSREAGKEGHEKAMLSIPMRGDPKEYRQRIADFTAGFKCAKKSPQRFIIVCPDLLTETISVQTDASIADARHIISTVRKTSDDEIYKEIIRTGIYE